MFLGAQCRAGGVDVPRYDGGHEACMMLVALEPSHLLGFYKTRSSPTLLVLLSIKFFR